MGQYQQHTTGKRFPTRREHGGGSALAHRGPRGSATRTVTMADRLHHTAAPHRLRPATGGGWPRAGLVPRRRGGPQPLGLPLGGWLGKGGPGPAPLSLPAAIVDDGAAAVGAEAVDINELHRRPPPAAAGLHVWRGRRAARCCRG